MREIKNIYHTKSESEQGSNLLLKFQKDSAQLLENYITYHKPIFSQYQKRDIEWDEYREKQLKAFREYKDSDTDLYNKFCLDCRALGYEMGDE